MSGPVSPDKPDKEKSFTPAPKKAVVKTKHLSCTECATPFPDGCKKKFCNACSAESLAKEKQKDMQSFLGWFQDNLAQTFETFKAAAATPVEPVKLKSHKRKRVSSPHSDLSSGEVSSSSYSASSSEESEDETNFPPQELRKFVKEVSRLFQDSDLSAHPKGLPMLSHMQNLMYREWNNPGKRAFISKHSKQLFYLQGDEKWEDIPKVDVQIAQLSKRTTIPISEVAGLKDPMDKRAETSCRRVYQSSGFQCKVALSSASVAKAQGVWLQSLEGSLSESMDEGLSKLFKNLRLANSFLLEAAEEGLKLSARNMGLSSVARRALWLRSWAADTASKSTLCDLPFERTKLFGSSLEELIRHMSDTKKALPQDRKSRWNKRYQYRPSRPFQPVFKTQAFRKQHERKFQEHPKKPEGRKF
ncbi:uncharacterized protein LOC128490990 [Spea bombifrons]|uniref:uncharacterized protein LOC128490990 n=1 Tax=Spea bombifrons TaxID=233779 RepID=UPI00234A5EBB|nr:uncharacterized protein LOC128490990 [Spea bombifrons]